MIFHSVAESWTEEEIVNVRKEEQEADGVCIVYIYFGSWMNEWLADKVVHATVPYISRETEKSSTTDIQA